MSQSQQLTVKQAISRAKKATKQGNAAAALQLYHAVLQQQPDHPVAKKRLRQLQRKLSQNQAVQRQATTPSQDQITALVNLYHTGQLAKTEQACRELLQTHPRTLIVINVLGAALQGQGRLQEAVESYEKAIEFKPDFAEAYSNRGNALRGLGQLNEAVESYEKAIEIKPDFAEAYGNRGNALRDLGQLKEAVDSYERAIGFRPDYAEAYNNRGSALRDLGMPKEAVESYEKAIEIKPDYASSHRNLSTLKKYEPDDVQIGSMECLSTDPGSSESDRMQLCFALAKAYEDLGKYDKSFHYLDEGNHVRKKELNYDIDNDRRMIARIREIFSTGGPTRDTESDGNASIQPLFIVGMPRSGTSLVEQILASHSKVHGAGELGTMSKLVAPILAKRSGQNINQDKSRLSQNEINAVHDGYLDALVGLNVPERLITDKMPLNFKWIGFILAAFPKTRIINLNRDARATCWSIYKHYFSGRGNGYAYDLLDLVEFYKLYVDLMSFWRERYPNSIYDLSYEDLTENQEYETRKLLAFCDLEWEEQCLDFHKTKRAVKTASTSQVWKKMYQGSSEAWRKYEEHLQPLIIGLG